ncbi:type II secretion system major pseudopilin GspG [Pseudoxanthomonas suwonensis]|jgi:general secretion pathway protein G|uniref:type II secretion system major pseudopilin GspG n=1 Tax=Pseudoxanthomonas suwonensis TaxID=314722 RepID=UPI00138F1434|nr:type II secretion system major pseudopilin GspG [Pseudoxanthomonas suwonensis]KAF1703336.1 type II secretion system protein GspG [Pseudoxanthomonas suwonensis]
MRKVHGIPGAARSGGFTLMELLVVVVIIGLLVALVAPRYFQQIGKSERTAAANQIDALRKAIDSYRLDVGRFPRQEDGLQALVVRPEGEARWQGPYLQRGVPMDPWGNPYVYRVPGAFGDYEVLSLGRDGKPGGEGEDADIGGDG